MDTVNRIRQKAKQDLKTIILPEYNDKRVVEAAKIVASEGIANVILLQPDKISAQDRDRYIETYYQMRQSKGMDINTARKLFEDTLYCAAMMVREGKADGFVAGANHTTADVARSSIHCIGMEERLNVASSCFIMVVPNCAYGEEGTFIFADCGIIPEPNSRQIACISIYASEMMQKVLEVTPRIAMLSYSTKGSAEGKAVDKITEALKSARSMAPDLLIDGELQVDAAIVPAVAKIKYPNSILAGKANILIFPNLEAGNISYKLVERLSGARAIGPIILGLNKPCSDLSRGCSVDDVIDCVSVTSIRAR